MIISGIGRLGRDAELRATVSGTSVVNLAVAFNFGKKQENGYRDSQWIDCSLWGKSAEALTQYLKKGNQVSITASDPHIEDFTRGDGTAGNKMVATVINIELISNGQHTQQAAQKPTQQQPRQQATQQNNSGQNGAYEDFQDDIPF